MQKNEPTVDHRLAQLEIAINTLQHEVLCIRHMIDEYNANITYRQRLSCHGMTPQAQLKARRQFEDEQADHEYQQMICASIMDCLGDID